VITANHAGTITVGGVATPIAAGAVITPAESVALAQVLHSPTGQSLVISSLGNATSGSLNLSYAAKNGATSLNIPAGVTAVQNVSKLANLSVTGNLVNAGVLQVLSQNAAVNTAVISALNISNLQTGLITSVLPAGGVSGFASAITSPVHFNLNAVQVLTNYGAIASSGNLTLSGSSITNALPAGVTGSTPGITAAANLNLVTNNLMNAGLITAGQNINIANAVGSNLAINALGGTFSAPNGIINIGTQNITD